MQIQGTQIRACPDCIQDRDWAQTTLARNQPAFRVRPGSELAEAFQAINDDLEAGEGSAWR